jgi:hypothetical protein
LSLWLALWFAIKMFAAGTDTDRGVEMQKPSAVVSALAVVAALCQFVALAKAQDYPTRPITIVVPYPAGGPTDLVGRVIADGMKRTLGQPVIVTCLGQAARSAQPA